MQYLGAKPTRPTDLVTLQDLDGLGGGATMGIKYGQTKAIGKLYAAMGLINTVSVPGLIAGDSITRGYKTGSTLATNPYAKRLYDRLIARFPLDTGSHPALATTTSPAAYNAATLGFSITNMGIPSTYSANYFTSTMRTAAGAANPRFVIHNVGTNDYRYFGIPIPTFKAALQAVITDLKSKISGPCVHILLHHYETRDAESGMPVATWAQYGQAKREIADADPDNVAFIDYADICKYMGAYAGSADALGLLPDGTHPSEGFHNVLGWLVFMAIFGGP